MPEVKMTMVLREPKKGSIRYDPAQGEINPLTNGFYFNKIPLLRGKTPANIRLTVEWDD